jgi:hypothetical protein
LKHEAALPEAPLCALDQINLPAINTAVQSWQQVLYFLFHLMPVGEVSQLLHQLAKWEITAGRVTNLEPEETLRLGALQYTMKLYLDMHDSHYTSIEADGKSMPEVERATLSAFIDFFESKDTFNLAFPEQGGGSTTAQYLPQRGLREIRRFGHIPVLKALVGQQRVAKATVAACLTAENIPDHQKRSPIAEAQHDREDLHKKWARDTRNFSGDDCRRYCEALQRIIKHRHAANQSRLVDHVAAHRIVMKVLARLVDFSGLYERDLTFVTLALMHEHGLTAADLFTAKGLKKFDNGQIFEALDNCNAIGANTQKLFNDLIKHVGSHSKGSTKRNTRNQLAHFGMLKSENERLAVPLNLTHWISQTRELMAYDRKLKNAVTKAVQELLEREGFDLTWQMGGDHTLSQATLSSRTASHLGSKKLSSGGKPTLITECLHSQELVTILANAFGGTPKPNHDVNTLDLANVDWSRGPVSHQKSGYAYAPQRPSRPK